MKRKNILEHVNKDSISLSWHVRIPQQDIMQLREEKVMPVADMWGRNYTVGQYFHNSNTKTSLG